MIAQHATIPVQTSSPESIPGHTACPRYYRLGFLWIKSSAHYENPEGWDSEQACSDSQLGSYIEVSSPLDVTTRDELIDASFA